MTAMVSHDLRSPLASMMITLDVITEFEQDKVQESILPKLLRLRSEADRLNRLVNTLLDIEKIESGTVDVSINSEETGELIRTAIDATQDLAKSGNVELVTSFSPKCTALCDKDRTVQILVNLISNAIKFAPAGSTVTVGAERLDSHVVRVEVTDTGCGVPPEKQGKLFGKFSQLDQPDEIKKKGSGLGLYICKMLVEAQKGKIGFEAPASGGSCFYIELPSDYPAL
ncbi:MAG: HAMP domain-containing histidine kinase [Cyanobacteria bacterium]|nr:HAMP domain-containing histidine kinase [Cyanobacteriota bacterium]